MSKCLQNRRLLYCLSQTGHSTYQCPGQASVTVCQSPTKLIIFTIYDAGFYQSKRCKPIWQNKGQCLRFYMQIYCIVFKTPDCQCCQSTSTRSKSAASVYQQCIHPVGLQQYHVVSYNLTQHSAQPVYLKYPPLSKRKEGGAVEG